MATTLKARLEALAQEWRGRRGYWTGSVFEDCAAALDEIIATLGQEWVEPGYHVSNPPIGPADIPARHVIEIMETA